MLMCGFFWRSNRDHYFLVLVMRALPSSFHERMYVSPKFNKQMHYYYDTSRGTMGILFEYVLFVLEQILTPIWKSCLAKFHFTNLSKHQDPKNNWRVPFKLQFFAHFSLVSLSVYPRSRRGAERIRQGEGRWSHPPGDDARTKRFDRESHTEAETRKLLTKPVPLKKMML